MAQSKKQLARNKQNKKAKEEKLAAAAAKGDPLAKNKLERMQRKK